MSSPTLRRTASCCPIFLSLMALVVSAAGQSTGGRILGQVIDSTGAVINGVTVTLVNEATGVTRNAKTDQNGDYTFVEVVPGNYRMEYSLQGFKKNINRSVVLELNQVLTLNATMQPGGAQETVEVTSEAPLVDTTSTQLGAVVNENAVNNLPLNERDAYALLQLQPGVQSQLGSDLFYGSDKPGVVSVNGGRGRSNNYSVNGGDGNDQFANLPVVQPSPDSIQEFRVITNTFDAEYGRNSGAIVNVVTKGGTNQFHGDVYEYFRNKVLNSRGYFDTVKPDLKQNQFGATLGGPIKKDRSFFFASYEGRRIIQGVSSDTVTVPTDDERLGDFSSAPLATFDGTLTDQKVADILNGRDWTGTPCSTAIANLGGSSPTAGALWSDIFPTNVIPRDCQDPVSLSLLQQYVPHGNAADDLFQAVPNGNNFANQFTLRFDHRINEHQQFNAYYYFTDHNGLDPFAKFESGGANLPGFGALTDERFQQWNLTHTWTLSPTMVNEARFTYFREGQRTFLHPEHTFAVTASCSQNTSLMDSDLAAYFASNPNVCFGGQADSSGAQPPYSNGTFVSNYGVTPGLGPDREGVPFINISGEFNIGNNLEGEIPQVGNTFQWTDNITKTIGKHTTKFGIDARRQRFDQTLYFNVNGWDLLFGGTENDVAFDDSNGDTIDLIPNYLLGLNDQYVQGAAQREAVRTTALYLFAQDSWKLKSNLTLNYGLRWEYNQPLTDVGHKVQTFRPGQADTVFTCQLSDGALGYGGFPVGTDCGPNGPARSIYPLGLLVPGDKGVPSGLTQSYYKAFAPRIGINWDPFKNGKTSIRAGFGLFYNPIEQLVLEQFSAEPPFGGSPLINTTLIQAPFYSQSDVGSQFPNPFNGILPTKAGDTVDWSIFRPILLYGEAEPHMRTQYSSQYNLSIQRQLSKDLVLQLGYVGSQGHRLLATHDINYGNAQTCNDMQAVADYYTNVAPDDTLATDYTCGPFYADFPFFLPANTIPNGLQVRLPYGNVPSIGPNNPDTTLVGLRRYSSPLCEPTTGADCPVDGNPVFSSIFAQDTVANSAYNSFQASLEKSFSRGLQFQVAYTWSKSFDQASSFEAILNPIDPRLSRSLSQFDARHRLVFSYVWALPTPKYSGLTGKIANGWDVSGIITAQRGFPIRITSQDDIEEMNSFDFELPGQPNQTAPFRHQDPKTNGGYWFDFSLFTNDTVPLGTFGNSKRTVCCGPGIGNWDFSLHKDTPVTERQSIEFRAEFFNLLNHTQFLQPDGNITDGSDFGRIKRARAPRQVQFALKYHF